jgi:hypothetical protein
LPDERFISDQHNFGESNLPAETGPDFRSSAHMSQLIVGFASKIKPVNPPTGLGKGIDHRSARSTVVTPDLCLFQTSFAEL